MKKVFRLFSMGILLYISSCSRLNNTNETAAINFDNLPKLTVHFDGNGLNWQPGDNAASYVIMKDGKEWKSVGKENYIVIVGEQGEFRVIGLNPEGKPLYSSETISLNLPEAIPTNGLH